MNIIDNTIFYEFSKCTAVMMLHPKVFLNILFVRILQLLYLLLYRYFCKFIYNYWTNNEYVLSNILMFLIIADAIAFNSFNSLETFIKSINKFLFSIASVTSNHYSNLTFALFTTGYSFLSYFLLSIISSIIIFNILILTIKILNKITGD